MGLIMLTETTPLNVGFAGAGAFATFVAAAVSGMPGIRIAGIADPDHGRAGELAQRHGACTVADWRILLQPGPNGVDAVVVATPPSTHAEIASAALAAGLHVFCEKPLGTTAQEAAMVVEAAARSRGTLVVDHVLRYNPILAAVTRLKPLLGDLQRLSYENDASDEHLDDRHWFWDEDRSGGILVEHGVHAFDAGHLLFGTLPLQVQAISVARPATALPEPSARRRRGELEPLTDLVVATTTHRGGAMATYAHSFTHADRCERQLLRLDFGSAEARIDGWIPVHAVLDIWTDDARADQWGQVEGRATELLAVAGFLPVPSTFTVAVLRDQGVSTARGRGVALELPHRVRVEIDLGGEAAKATVYARSVRAAMTDLLRCAATEDRPVSGAAEGQAAVVVAAAGRQAAREGRTVGLPWAG